MKLTAKYQAPTSLRVRFRPQSMGVSTGIPVARDYVERDPYEGPYEVTPSAEAQTLSTNGFRMTDDITIGAIPQNYGLITWNGSTLTVS